MRHLDAKPMNGSNVFSTIYYMTRISRYMYGLGWRLDPVVGPHFSNLELIVLFFQMLSSETDY